ncbi:hypothetical protein BC833DRAFT_604001 [Globomyces pollinis-pini]|nr:hypothetical protein BC833DRAFT_604001 [Globomyces pollinis-pini]
MKPIKRVVQYGSETDRIYHSMVQRLIRYFQILSKDPWSDCICASDVVLAHSRINMVSGFPVDNR